MKKQFLFLLYIIVWNIPISSIYSQTQALSWDLDIKEAFLQLPDSLFMTDELMVDTLYMNNSNRKILLDTRSIPIGKSGNRLLELEKLDSNYIQIGAGNSLIGEDLELDYQYSIKRWYKTDGSRVYSIFRRFSDACCTYTKVWILEPNEDGWKDITNVTLPMLCFDDFVVRDSIHPVLAFVNEFSPLDISLEDEKQLTVRFLTYCDDCFFLDMSGEEYDLLGKLVGENEDDYFYAAVKIIEDCIISEIKLEWDGQQFNKKND